MARRGDKGPQTACARDSNELDITGAPAGIPRGGGGGFSPEEVLSYYSLLLPKIDEIQALRYILRVRIAPGLLCFSGSSGGEFITARYALWFDLLGTTVPSWIGGHVCCLSCRSVINAQVTRGRYGGKHSESCSILLHRHNNLSDFLELGKQVYTRGM